jgi:cell wall-associated NlpC family hydrolase
MEGSSFLRDRVAIFAIWILLPVYLASADPTPTPAPHKKHHPTANSDGGSDNATPASSPASGKSGHRRTHHADDEDDHGSPVPSHNGSGNAGEGFHQPAEKHAADADAPETPPDSTPKSKIASDESHPAASPAPSPAATSSIDASELRDFDTQPAPVRALLQSALELTRRNLTYTYGSSDPANGGLDCSGTIYYLLKNAAFDDVPRSASEQYAWVRQQSRFYAVLSKKEDTFELKEMRPGDLLFWTGTYHVDHDPPVTHTMLYLGRRKQDGKPLMMGASDGRPYDGEKRNGVSVFDFKMPAARSADTADATTAAAPDHAPDFAGYGPIPGMAERSDAASRQAAVGAQTPATKSPAKHPAP